MSPQVWLCCWKPRSATICLLGGQLIDSVSEVGRSFVGLGCHCSLQLFIEVTKHSVDFTRVQLLPLFVGGIIRFTPPVDYVTMDRIQAGCQDFPEVRIAAWATEASSFFKLQSGQAAIRASRGQIRRISGIGCVWFFGFPQQFGSRVR